MPRSQHTAPIPSDPDGHTDIMAAGPQDRDITPGRREPSPIPSDPDGQADIMSAEPADREDDRA
jgi:hypothetical protein